MERSTARLAIIETTGFQLTGRNLAGKFFPSSEFETNISSAFLFDTCCPEVNCSMLTRSKDVTCYTCPEQTRVGTAICSNPDASCQIAIFDSFECFPPKI